MIASIVAALLMAGSYALGAAFTRDTLTGHWRRVGRWCGTCHSWEPDFYAHIYWCHPTHADSTTPGPAWPDETRRQPDQPATKEKT